MRDRQAGLNAEAARIQTETQQKTEWSRALLRSLGDLAESQKGLGSETAEVAKKELTTAPVFAKLVRNSAERMEQSAQRAEEMRKETPPVDKLPDAELKQRQQEALRPLEQLLDAIKTEAAALSNNASGGGSADAEAATIANRKVCRHWRSVEAVTLDARRLLNKRTEAFRKAREP